MLGERRGGASVRSESVPGVFEVARGVAAEQGAEEESKRRFPSFDSAPSRQNAVTSFPSSPKRCRSTSSHTGRLPPRSEPGKALPHLALFPRVERGQGQQLRPRWTWSSFAGSARLPQARTGTLLAFLRGVGVENGRER
jgi:hypothetical protein